MFPCDLHNHTLNSPDAIGSMSELATRAASRGVRVLGITEHGPGMVDGPNEELFSVALQVTNKVAGIEILWGVECNVMDLHGAIDLGDHLASQQDIVLAGLHLLTPYPEGTDEKQNTDALIATMANHNVDVICHPYRDDFPTDIALLVDAARESGVLLEVNVSVLRGPECSPRVVEATSAMIALCRECGYPLALGSDAHAVHELADYSPLLRLDELLRPEDVWSADFPRPTRLQKKWRLNGKHRV